MRGAVDKISKGVISSEAAQNIRVVLEEYTEAVVYAALHPQRNNDYAQVKITGPELLELLKSAEASFEAFYKKIHDNLQRKHLFSMFVLQVMLVIFV